MLFVVATVMAPASVLADSASVTQIITITARVAPARSIVVNDQGVMTKIYSNTPEAVTPKVYLNSVPGKAMPLTPQLMQQYQTIIDHTRFLNGVEVPVAPAVAAPGGVRQFLTKTMSSLALPARYLR